jgi:hypothetical protein
MFLAGVPFVESLALALSTWGSLIAIMGAGAGFLALLSGRPYREIEERFVYGSVAAALPGFLLAIATVILVEG